MFGTPPSFVEAGGASEVVALLDAGIPLVESQADLTPFQRMCILKELERQQAQAQQGGPGGAAPAGTVNELRQPRGGGRGETVTYVNEGSE
jgi:hypothetical protein